MCPFVVVMQLCVLQQLYKQFCLFLVPHCHELADPFSLLYCQQYPLPRMCYALCCVLYPCVDAHTGAAVIAAETAAEIAAGSAMGAQGVAPTCTRLHTKLPCTDDPVCRSFTLSYGMLECLYDAGTGQAGVLVAGVQPCHNLVLPCCCMCVSCRYERGGGRPRSSRSRSRERERERQDRYRERDR